MKIVKIAYLLLIGFLLLTFNHCIAQAFTIVKATRQGAAGGVVGNYGANYWFELETSSKKNIPDTIWVDGNIFPINFSHKDGRNTRSFDSATHKIKYTILVSWFHTGNRGPNQNMPDTASAKKPMHMRQFEGGALVSYTVKHKQHFFIIKSVTRLKQLNYP